MKESLSDLNEHRAKVRRQIEAVGRSLSTLQAELAMVDYKIACHKDYKPQISRPLLYEDFDNGKVVGLPKDHQRVTRRKAVIDLDGLDLEDLDL
jgi:hypothetical protein